MYPCLRKVMCGYEGCDKEVIQKNLKKHTKSKHGSSIIKAVPLKNITFGVSGNWNGSATASSSLRVVSSASRQQRSSTANAAAVPTAEELKDDSSASCHQQPSIANAAPAPAAGELENESWSRQQWPSTANAAAAPVAKDLEDDPSVSCQQQSSIASSAAEPAAMELENDISTPTSTCQREQLVVGPVGEQRKHHQEYDQGLRDAVERNSDAISSVNQKLDSLLQHLQASNPPMSSQRNDSLGSGDVAVLFRSARSIRTLQSAADEHLVSCPERNMLYCDLCVPVPEDASKRAAGTFEYDFGCGVDFPVGKKLHQKFKGLKTTISSHFASSKHKEAETKVLLGRAREERVNVGCGVAAERVLRAAYHVTMQSGSHKSFERLIVMLSKCGLDIGDKNHSAGMMVKARDAFYTVILDKIATIIEGEPCVAVIADKVTLNKRTVDITAVNVVMPDAPPEAMLQNFVIAAPVVQAHSGEGLASELKDSLARVGVTRPTQVSAFGGDGQYHHLGVPEKLSRGLQGDGEGEFTMPALWDPSHLMHLAEQNARNSATCAWVDDTISTMNLISQRFRYGAGFESLLRAEGPGKPKTLKSWSETRFAAHAADVFRSFLDNIDFMLDALCRRREEESQVPADLKQAIHLLKDRKFLARVAALCDIYAVLGKGSRDQQDTKRLPWEITAAFGSTLLDLDVMVTTLDSCTATFESAVQKSIRLANLEEQWPRAAALGVNFLEQIHLIKGFCSTLLRNLRERRVGTSVRSVKAHNELLLKQMPNVRGVADLTRLSQSRRTLPDQVSDVLSSMRALAQSGLIPRSSMVTESSVLEALSVLRTASCEPPTNQSLLKLLWGLRNERPLLRAYVDLVKRLWLIFPVESVVESMSSVLKEVFGTHRILKHENAAKELVVRWNGPHETMAEPFLQAVQERFKFEFRRSTNAQHRLGAMLKNRATRRGKWDIFQ